MYGRASSRRCTGIKQQVVTWLVYTNLTPQCAGKRQIGPPVWLHFATPACFWEVMNLGSIFFFFLFVQC